MAELNLIAEAFRQQRRDLSDLIENTSSRSSETAALVQKIPQPRERSEERQGLHHADAS